jgi:hypothetical protein
MEDGSSIWLLYKDHCDFNVDCFIDTVDPNIVKEAALLEGVMGKKK